jgi:hypothetical protein
LRTAVEFAANDRGVVSDVCHLGGLPANFAGGFFECDDRAFVAAGSADEHIAVDEHRLAIAPVGFLASQVDERDAPDFTAIGGADAGEDAFAIERVDEAIVDRRGRARSVTPIVFEVWPKLRRPALFAGVRVERQQIGIAFAAAHRVENSVDDRRTCIAAAALAREPHELRSAFGPFLK